MSPSDLILLGLLGLIFSDGKGFAILICFIGVLGLK
jgi:hypothetical protein